MTVPRPDPKPKPARKPKRDDAILVFERRPASCDFAFEGDVEDVEEDGPTSDSMLELQMDGMKVKEEAWPQPRAVPPPLPAFGPPPTISKTKNRAIRPPPLPAASLAPRRSSSSQLRAVDPVAAIAAFAGFGEPPRGFLSMPSYALRVRARRRVLRRELAETRGRGSADAVLYEQAIASADASAVRAGYALICLAPLLVAAVVVAFLMVVSPH